MSSCVAFRARPWRATALRVPLATYVGWNRRHPDIGEPGLPYWMLGSYFLVPAFAATLSEDPRQPILSRYRDQDDYIAQAEVGNCRPRPTASAA